MVTKDPLKIYIGKQHDAFGHFITLYQQNRLGEIAVAVNMEMKDWKTGQAQAPLKGDSFPVDEESLRDLGEYLIDQGLITTPRERSEYEQLKIEHEELKKAHEEVLKAFDESNEVLDEITFTLQEMVDKHREGE